MNGSGPDAQRAVADETPDSQLVRLAQDGDASGFGRLYERYFEKVYSYLAFKLGNRTDAEDVTEQVFLKALESRGNS
jgi:RNA polymerase sigma-70 factor, ECF subfamily